MSPVTDPSIVAQLNAAASSGTTPTAGAVTDPAVIAKLNAAATAPSAPSTLDKVIAGTKNIGMGALKGASDIGTTILRPVDAALNATGLSDTTNADRKASLGQFFQQNADPNSWAFKGGEIAADIAGTAGIGGVLGKGVMAASEAIPAIANYAPKLAAALESGGFKLGSPAATTTAGRVVNAATRIGAGTAVGGASAGLIDPSTVGTGAALGAALPVVAKAAGMAGRALAPTVSPEVAALYQKAQNLGIDIPADRIINSRPINALASSLNYVPLSGRAATEEGMASQLNQALSRTFGQNTDNVTQALRNASGDLGAKFDAVLQNHSVNADNQFVSDLVGNMKTASDELPADSAGIIGKQIDNLLSKVDSNGQIDGQAAYNIKKTLDRIGNQNAPVAYYARDLKKTLMSALNRSLGPLDAADFATLRQQYGNMLDLENLAQNGAEGGISIGRLANMKNINNQPLQDIADIAAQFVKAREGAHGAAQRVTLGLGAAGAGAFTPAAAPAIVGGIALGRVANTALNSQTLKNLVLNLPSPPANRLSALASPLLRTGVYDAANRSNP